MLVFNRGGELAMATEDASTLSPARSDQQHQTAYDNATSRRWIIIV